MLSSSVERRGASWAHCQSVVNTRSAVAIPRAVILHGRPARRRASCGLCPALRDRGTACSCPGLRSADGSTRQCTPGIEDADVGRRADAEMRRREPSIAAGRDVMRASAAGQRNLVFRRPFERERQQQLQTGRAGLRLAERQLLAVVVDRRVIRADESIVPSASPARNAARSRVPRSGGISRHCASNQPMSTSHRCR